MYNVLRGAEKRSGGTEIYTRQERSRDCSWKSRDRFGGLELYWECHGYDMSLQLKNRERKRPYLKSLVYPFIVLNVYHRMQPIKNQAKYLVKQLCTVEEIV